MIQLSNGTLRPVEDLNTDDFIKSAELSNEVQIDQSVVVSITPSKHKRSVMLGFSVGKEEVQVRLQIKGLDVTKALQILNVNT